MSRSMEQAPKDSLSNTILGFNGSDGSGKTTIALALRDQLIKSGTPAINLYTLGYSAWANKEETNIFDDWTGLLDATEDQNDRPIAVDRLGIFENRSLACTAIYGTIAKKFYLMLAEHKRQKNPEAIVIDSDPVIKGFVWAHIGETDIQKSEIDFWSGIIRSTRFLPDRVLSVAPVNVGASEYEIGSSIVQRLLSRGNTSSTDPHSLDTAIKRHNAAEAANTILTEQHGAKIIRIFNPTVCPDVLSSHINDIAKMTIDLIQQECQIHGQQ